MSDTQTEPKKKLNRLQSVLQEKKATQNPTEQITQEEIHKEEIAEVVDTKPKKKKKVKYKYKRVTLYMSYEDDGWTKTIGKQYTRRTKTKITKSLLYSVGLKQLQKLEEKEFENLLVEEAKKRAVDLV